MKRILMLKATLSAVILATAAFSAGAVEGMGTSVSTAHSSRKPVTTFKYGIEGVGVHFTGNRADFNFLGGFHFGWGILPTKGLQEYDNNIWKSFDFEWNIGQLNLKLNSTGTLYATGAINMSWSNIVWDNSNKRLLDSEMDVRVPVFDNTVGKGSKSKIRVDYIGLPVGLSYQKDHMTIYGNVSAEVLTAAKTKFKCENGEVLKTDLKCPNKFRSRLEVGLAYENIGFFVSYSLTQMFRLGPDIHPVNFGIVWLWN